MVFGLALLGCLPRVSMFPFPFPQAPGSASAALDHGWRFRKFRVEGVGYSPP